MAASARRLLVVSAALLALACQRSSVAPPTEQAAATPSSHQTSAKLPVWSGAPEPQEAAPTDQSAAQGQAARAAHGAAVKSAQLTAQSSSPEPPGAEAHRDDRAPSSRAPGDRAPGDRAPGDRAPGDRAPGDRAQHIYALATRVFIRARPSLAAGEIGALRIGQGARTVGPIKPTHDCPQPGGFYPVAPSGYVCLDQTTTTQASHPLVVAKQRYRADYNQDAPHRYGESIETPIYSRIPTEEEQRRSEYQLPRHLDAVRAVREAEAKGEAPKARATWRLRGASAALATGAPPSFLLDHRDSPWHRALSPSGAPSAPPGRARIGVVPPRSTLSFIDEFTVAGRSFLLTPELTVVPKDKVRELSPSRFMGVRLAGSQRLPLAFFRRDESRAWRLTGEVQRASLSTAQDAPFTDDAPSAARLEPDTHRFERLSHVELTGRARWQRGRRFLETRESGLFVAQDEVAVVTLQRLRGVTLSADERWLDVSIFQGTLTAYEGERPVFTTLISPGASGYKPRKGPDRKNTTPTGTFRIEWKHRSTTMSPDPERRRYYLTDVPFTQFFQMPFALHAAYWHDRFGEPMSGGCVNLSVADARWLFDFTSPSLPPGWHSVRAGGERGEGTWVSIR